MLTALFRLVLISFALSGPAAFAASPPVQPKTGPGGMEYGAGEVIKRGVGRASAGTYVFHSSADPAPEGRPVAVFLHAWGAVNPVNYGGWIEHLARRGYLVLFPAFQTVGRTRPADAATIAAGRIKEALAALADDAAAKPNLARVAFIGHSAGAGVAAALAALAEETGLPAPRLVFMLMPGGIASDPKSRGVQLGDLSKIGPRTALLTMVGDRDAAASDRAARRILREATAVPVGQKLFMRSGSDDHGFPTLSATLSAPGSPREGYDMAAIRLPPDPPVNPRERQPAQPRFSPDMVLSGEQIILLGQINRSQTDTLDFLAFWKTYDMAAEAAFGTTELATLRTNPAFLDMGRWSDGWPVRRLAAETPRTDVAPPPVATVAPVVPVTPKAPATRKPTQKRNPA